MLIVGLSLNWCCGAALVPAFTTITVITTRYKNVIKESYTRILRIILKFWLVVINQISSIPIMTKTSIIDNLFITNIIPFVTMNSSLDFARNE